jgi:NADP-dependent 3-hydroxy acid dehydrogenase YdfG
MYKNGASQMAMISIKELLRYRKMHFNKVVWIAGASSGIGKELAIRLYNNKNSYFDFFECIAVRRSKASKECIILCLQCTERDNIPTFSG